MSNRVVCREASHAGSWYTASGRAPAARRRRLAPRPRPRSAALPRAAGGTGADGLRADRVGRERAGPASPPPPPGATPPGARPAALALTPEFGERQSCPGRPRRPSGPGSRKERARGSPVCRRPSPASCARSRRPSGLPAGAPDPGASVRTGPLAGAERKCPCRGRSGAASPPRGVPRRPERSAGCTFPRRQTGEAAARELGRGALGGGWYPVMGAAARRGGAGASRPLSVRIVPVTQEGPLERASRSPAAPSEQVLALPSELDEV